MPPPPAPPATSATGDGRLPWSHRLRARTTVPAAALAAVAFLAHLVVSTTPVGDAQTGSASSLPPVLLGVAVALLLWALAAGYLPRRGALPSPRVLESPVDGPWAALHSPATKVPSHGTHAYGQTWAVDLVAEPDDGSRPGFGSGPALRPPEDFPGFGRPVRAPAAGRVVTAVDGARDHRSRSSVLALLSMAVEAAVRELGGPGRLLGNHVVVDLGDGAYSLVAHLRRGSVAVRPGEQVAAGRLLGECGNSGSSSEPHLHVQLMDHRRPGLAAGLPMAFRDVEVGGVVTTGLPGDGEVLRSVARGPHPAAATAPEPAPSAEDAPR